MKHSIGISNFLEEISSLSHSIVFLHCNYIGLWVYDLQGHGSIDILSCLVLHIGEKGFPGGDSDKEPPANAGDLREWGQSLGGEHPLEEGMTTHFSILAGRIPYTEEPVGYSLKGCKGLDTTEVT